MATITVRNLKEETKRNLRIRAAKHGVSMEEEARVLLEQASTQPPRLTSKKGSWVDEVRALFKDIGDSEFEIPPRQPMKPPIDFSGPEYDR